MFLANGNQIIRENHHSKHNGGKPFPLRQALLYCGPGLIAQSLQHFTLQLLPENRIGIGNGSPRMPLQFLVVVQEYNVEILGFQ